MPCRTQRRGSHTKANLARWPHINSQEALHHSAPISPLVEPFRTKLHVSFRQLDATVSEPEGSLGEHALHKRSHADAEQDALHSPHAASPSLRLLSGTPPANGASGACAPENSETWSLLCLTDALEYPSPKVARSPARCVFLTSIVGALVPNGY